MATGEVADLEAIAAAARRHGALTLVDATQACGWLPLDGDALRHRRRRRLQVAALAARHGLHGGRTGAARRDRPDSRRLVRRRGPARVVLRAGRSGSPRDARRLDTSPAWHSWVGAAPALALLEEIGVDAIHAHDLGLANRFRAGLGLEPGDSAIVFVDVPEAEATARAGRDPGCRARRPAADVVAPLQHRRRRRPDARGAHARRASACEAGRRAARPSCAASRAVAPAARRARISTASIASQPS